MLLASTQLMPLSFTITNWQQLGQTLVMQAMAKLLSLAQQIELLTQLMQNLTLNTG